MYGKICTRSFAENIALPTVVQYFRSRLVHILPYTFNNLYLLHASIFSYYISMEVQRAIYFHIRCVNKSYTVCKTNFLYLHKFTRPFVNVVIRHHALTFRTLSKQLMTSKAIDDVKFAREKLLRIRN